MKNDHLLDAVNSLEDDLVAEAADYTPARKRRRWLLPAVAAALALVMGLGVFLALGVLPQPRPAQINLVHAYETFDRRLVMSYKNDMGEKVDPLDLVYDYVVPEDVVCVSWAPFFLHDGRYYCSIYSNISADYIGEKVAEIRLTSERQPLKFANDTGKIDGDVYEVKGYDPTFMLCMKDRNNEGEVIVFICDNGYTVTTGADVLEDRFHVSETLTSLVYEGRLSDDEGYGERYSLSPDEPAVVQFLNALDKSGWFVPYETEEELTALWMGRSWKLTLHAGDIPITLMMLGDGYVEIITGFGGYCLRPNEKQIRPLLELMEKTAGEPVENTDKMRGYRIEDARNQPVYGKYIPDYVPDNVEFASCFFNYDVDDKTKETLATTEMSLLYENKDGKFAYVEMRFGGPEKRENHIYTDEDNGVRHDENVPLSELTADSFKIIIDEETDFIYSVCVFEGDIWLEFTADNVDVEQALMMIRDAFDN